VKELLTPVPTHELVVSEVFGPTFQGEGPSLGRRCSFLRLGGCNLACRWCDTSYTWDWSGKNGVRYDPSTELRREDWGKIWQDLMACGTDMLVISGGEPLLQQQALLPLLETCRDVGWRVEIETAGTIEPSPMLTDLVDGFNVSPKLANSGNVLRARLNVHALEALQSSGKASWKFVAVEPIDLDEVAVVVEQFGLQPVYVMPEGIAADVITERARALAEPVLRRGWNLTTRLQVLLYGNRRGV
jgi:7-carboxy-7-deazaguanine synthase